MNQDQFLREFAPAIALARVLGAGESRTVMLHIAYLAAVLPKLAPGDRVPRKTLVNLLEDLRLGLSDREVRRTLLLSGLAHADGATLTAPNVVEPLTADDGVPETGFALTRDDLGDLFGRLLHEPSAAVPTTLGIAECLATISRSSQWACKIAEIVRKRGLAGVPVFWDEVDGEYEPFNLDPGSLTTSDTLRLMIERVRFGGVLPPSEAVRGTVEFLAGLLLQLQCKDAGWDHGGIRLQRWDDDFVGSYSDSLERSPCPTVDATGGAVVALCCALRCGVGALSGTDQSATEEAIRAGVAFLIRSQSASGAWPKYRYDGDPYKLPDDEVSSRYAIDGMSEAFQLGILGPAAEKAVRQSIGAFQQRVFQTMRSGAKGRFWVPCFESAFARDEDKLRATSLILLAMHSARVVAADAHGDFDYIQGECMAFAADVWKPGPDRFVRIEFRVPTVGGPADSRFPWEWPADPMVVSWLLKVESTGKKLIPELRRGIASAVQGFLAAENDGHWDDFLMKKEGKVRAMPPNTLQYHQALLDFLSAEVRMVDQVLPLRAHNLS